MDPRDQARLVRLEYGGHGQNFGSNGFSGYGAGTSTATPTAGRVDPHTQRNPTNNGAVASPASYARQQGVVTSPTFDSPGRDPRSPATQELKSPPTGNPRILDSALLSSFLEHTRREGPTAHTCAACNVSFQTNSGLDSHAKESGHHSFLCACDTSFGRFSSLARHINSNTGSGFHCELCEDRTLPRLDKLYDHLRDGHKVSQRVLDRYRNKALGRARKVSRAAKPAPAPPPAPYAVIPVTPSGSFGSWSSAGHMQVNGMYGRNTMSMNPSSPNSVNPANLTNFNNNFAFQ